MYQIQKQHAKVYSYWTKLFSWLSNNIFQVEINLCKLSYTFSHNLKDELCFYLHFWTQLLLDVVNNQTITEHVNTLNVLLMFFIQLFFFFPPPQTCFLSRLRESRWSSIKLWAASSRWCFCQHAITKNVNPFTSENIIFPDLYL